MTSRERKNRLQAIVSSIPWDILEKGPDLILWETHSCIYLCTRVCIINMKTKQLIVPLALRGESILYSSLMTVRGYDRQG